MEATAANPVLKAIKEELKEAKEGWEGRVFSSIVFHLECGAPKKSGAKPTWPSWQMQKQYTDLLELACQALESSPDHNWSEQIQDLIEKHFEGNFTFLPPKIRELVIMNFPFSVSQ